VAIISQQILKAITVVTASAAPVTLNLTIVLGDTAAAITTAVTATGTLSWYSDAAGTVFYNDSTISTSAANGLQHTM
jgi:hypothetical protein